MQAPSLAPGTVVASRFRVTRRIGTGGMGAVYAAEQVDLGRPVAIKLLHDGNFASEEQVRRFEREARAAGQLAHPNIVGVTSLALDPELGPILVMELLQGESLAQRIDDHGALAPQEAVAIFEQALDGLYAAHVAGMIHRDLKPANIFLVPLSAGTLVKVLDFGIVKFVDDIDATKPGKHGKLTVRGTALGTPNYMSPEQARGAPVDLRTDVYAAGACLYEALAGTPPYDGATALEILLAVDAGPPRDIETYDGVPPALAHIVRRAMARNVDDRFPTARDLALALRKADLTVPDLLTRTRVDRPTRTGEDAPTRIAPAPFRRIAEREPVAPPADALAASHVRPAPTSSDAVRLPSRRAPLVVAVAALVALALVAAMALGLSSSSTTHATPPRAAQPLAVAPLPVAAPSTPPPVTSPPPVTPLPPPPVTQPPPPPVTQPPPPSLPAALDAGTHLARPHPPWPHVVAPPPPPPPPPPQHHETHHAGEDVLDPFGQ